MGETAPRRRSRERGVGVASVPVSEVARSSRAISDLQVAGLRELCQLLC
jgi:hypothetical protein